MAAVLCVEVAVGLNLIVPVGYALEVTNLVLVDAAKLITDL